jgi:glycerate 2-kinase
MGNDPKKAQRRTDALDIFQAALRAADPRQCVFRSLQLEGDHLKVLDTTYALRPFSKIVVVGAGKATPAMAAAVEEILGDNITAGAINTKYDHGLPLKYITTTECGHPIPDQAGVSGTEHMISLLQDLDEDALVIGLFSGGGSALLPAPAAAISLAEKQETTQMLLACGAPIDEINTIRKHLSSTKGGLLAHQAFPARVVSLMLSDVIGDPLDTIASGPTHPDSTSFADCLKLVDRYQLGRQLPAAVYQRLQDGFQGRLPETPKRDDPCFEKVQTLVIGNNALALAAAQQAARDRGYQTLVLSSRIEGESREVAAVHAAIAQEIRSSAQPLVPPACVISGGETTVTLRGKGKGGRNQEFVLAACLRLQAWEGITLLSGGTDGTDGPTDAAGALGDGTTVERAQKLGLSAAKYLDQNDSYHFFKALDDLVITGPTNTNVMDLQIVLVS